ncbi:MAG: 50S ribosomal protein L18 [Nanoarchaeota archaeon]|nr:50S ribosomal protein L18 [Nanoarchaeota archaeon]
MKKIGRTIRRRRKEGKTDYKARLGFLKSGKPRAIVRKTNRYIIGQIVISDIAQDKVIVSVNSKDLLSHGWPSELKGSLKNLSACYLTGFLLGKKSKDIKEAIFDIGLHRNVKKSRLYAFLKGLIDSGIELPYNKEALPSDEEIKKNEKTADLIEKIKGGLK